MENEDNGCCAFNISPLLFDLVVLAKIKGKLKVGETGKVVGIDHIKELVDLSKRNIEKNHAHLLTSGRVIMVEGDGRLGYAPCAPYKAIHVGAAAPTLPPKVLLLSSVYVCRFICYLS